VRFSSTTKFSSTTAKTKIRELKKIIIPSPKTRGDFFLKKEQPVKAVMNNHSNLAQQFFVGDGNIIHLTMQKLIIIPPQEQLFGNKPKFQHPTSAPIDKNLQSFFHVQLLVETDANLRFGKNRARTQNPTITGRTIQIIYPGFFV